MSARNDPCDTGVAIGECVSGINGSVQDGDESTLGGMFSSSLQYPLRVQEGGFARG